MKAILIGLVLLAISGIDLYLPDVGNAFDYWRVGVALVSFIVGCVFVARGLTDYVD